MKNLLTKLSPGPRLRRTGGYAAMLLVGLVLGALAFGSRGGTARHEHAAATGAETAEVWTCSMHPQIRQPEPGPCPICGMDLIPVEGSAGGDEKPPDRITLSERARALARLRTSAVRRQDDPAVEVRLLGRIEADETTLRTVTAWTGGRIERLHVNVTGQRIRSGQVIATLYSPEIFSAHQDLLVTRRQVDRLGGAAEVARSAAEATLAAARDRLRLLGVGDELLAAMEKEATPKRQIPIHSPFGGTVIERVASEGAYVTTGEPLYRVADLSRLWVQLDAYESDLPALKVDQTVRLEVDSLPGEAYEGRVAFIEPTVDPARRTAQVRVQVPNEDGRLRPGMFAQAVVAGRSGEEPSRPLVIPRSAPLFTGRRSLVYVEVPGAERPTYEARVVRLGPLSGEVYPVVAGLSEGERVVTRGAFVLDADLQIRGGRSMLGLPDDTEPGAWDEIVDLPAAERKKLAPVVAAYLEAQRALAADRLKETKEAAQGLATHAAAVRIPRPAAASEAWLIAAQGLRQHAQHLGHATSLEEARSAFEALTAEVEQLLSRFGNPLDRPLRLAFCPMAAGSRGASWLQQDEQVDNPYFGESMRTCGEVRSKVAPGAHLPSSAHAEPRAAAPAGEHRH